MWPNSRETIDLVTFTEGVRHGNLIFCGVFQRNLNQLKQGLKECDSVSISCHIYHQIHISFTGRSCIFRSPIFGSVQTLKAKE